MGRSWLLSSLLHAGLAGLLYFGLPSFMRPPPAMEQAVTVELVTDVPDTEHQPPAPEVATTAPAPERQAATPEPNPIPPPPALEPKPVPPPPAPPQAEPAPPPQPEPPPPAPAQAEPAPPPQPAPPQPEVALAEPDVAPEPPPAPEPAVQPQPPPEPVTQPEPAPQPVPPPEVAKPEPPPPAPPAPKPIFKPEPPKMVANEPPPQPKPEPQPQPQAKPEPPKPEPPKEDAFAALLKSVEQMDRRVESQDVQTGQGRSAVAEGQARTTLGEAPLSFSELDALRRQIGGCWTLPVGVEGIQDMVVQLRIEVRPDRTVQRVTIQDQSRFDRDPSFRAVAESARRAVDKCSPLTLPPGKYAVWRDIMMNFYPQDAISG
jgi:hypothetical protein